jgi:uncharacterized protein (DUF2164 family)
MSKIEFSKEERAVLVGKIRLYYKEELNQDHGQFDAECLLDFITEEMGPLFYNRGLFDAQTLLESRMESITEALYEIEKPSDFHR